MFHELSQSAIYKKTDVNNLLSCGPSPFSREKTELIVYNVLMAAYSQDGDKGTIKRVFSYEFGCLQLMKNKSEYKKLLNNIFNNYKMTPNLSFVCNHKKRVAPQFRRYMEEQCT